MEYFTDYRVGDRVRNKRSKNEGVIVEIQGNDIVISFGNGLWFDYQKTNWVEHVRNVVYN